MNKDLESRLSKLEEQVSDMQTESAKDSMNFLNLLLRFPAAAVFTPSSKGFQTVYTSTGPIFVSLEDIKPYANGYKLRFQLGNPLSATINSPELLIMWSDSDRKVSSESAKRTEQKLTQSLRPGTWTNVTTVLAPATKEEIANVRIEISTGNVGLGLPR